MDKISYTNKATIPSGLPYSNTSPCYTITREYGESQTQNVLDMETQEIKAYIDGMITKDFLAFKDYQKQQGATDHRFTEIEGVKVPHVTNIITPDRPAIPNIEEHALLGTALDQAVKNWMDLGVWVYEEVSAPSISGNSEEILSLIAEWFEKNDVRLVDHSIKVHSKEYNYCGELDAVGYEGNDFTIFDVKKTKKITKALYEKYFMQMSAYAKCLAVEPELMCIISPHNKPIVEANVDKYFNKFLIARGRYQERFSV